MNVVEVVYISFKQEEREYKQIEKDSQKDISGQFTEEAVQTANKVDNTLNLRSCKIR